MEGIQWKTFPRRKKKISNVQKYGRTINIKVGSKVITGEVVQVKTSRVRGDCNIGASSLR